MAALEILKLANYAKLGHVQSRILGYVTQASEQSRPEKLNLDLVYKNDVKFDWSLGPKVVISSLTTCSSKSTSSSLKKWQLINEMYA